MKIAIISTMNGAEWGGSEELWLDLVKHAQESGHECHIYKKINSTHPKMNVINPNTNILFKKRRIINKLIKLITQKLPNDPTLIEIKMSRLLTWINPYNQYFKTDFDFILISQGATFDLHNDIFLMAHILKHKQKNLFTICHWNTDYSKPIYFPYKWHRKIFSKFNYVFFVSRRNQQTTERQLSTKFTNSKIIKNPINRTNVNYIKFPLIEENYRLASVASLKSMTKGQDVLLEVISKTKWRERNFILHLFGEGGDKSYLEELVHLYELDDKVIFEGYSSVEEIWEKCHILVMPSISEGLPLALIEAMTAGRTAVVTHIAGMPETITEGVNGFIAEAPKDIFLDAALERAWEKRHSWEELGKNAREDALRNNYEENAGEVLFNLIKKSIKEDHDKFTKVN